MATFVGILIDLMGCMDVVVQVSGIWMEECYLFCLEE